MRAGTRKNEVLATSHGERFGMSAARLATIDRVIERGIRAGGYPGAAVVVGRKGAAVWEKGFGRLGWTNDDGSVVAERTIYDLASLTKVVGTTTAVMILFDEGKLRLDEWEGKDGSKRHGLSVAAFRVELLHQIGKNRPPATQKAGRDRRGRE